MTATTAEAICRDDCTSGCHASDCEHHGHPPAQPAIDVEALTEALNRVLPYAANHWPPADSPDWAEWAEAIRDARAALESSRP